MQKLSPWCLAAIATMAPLGAIGGASGAFAGHVAVLAITLGIFIGTLTLNRAPAPRTATATPLPVATAQLHIEKAPKGPLA